MRRLLLGAAAGAAGTTALNAVTYADMVWRARPASSTPEETVKRSASRLGVQVPGEGEQRQNRLTGLGALSGIGTGVAFGVGYALLDVLGLRPPPALGWLVAAGGAMAGANVPMATLGVSDPRTWSATDWASDVVPHLAYGAVVASVYEAGRR
jgi:hypothetical protein